MPTSSFVLTSSTALPITTKSRTTQTPGSIATWIFIYAELTEFGFFFLAFLIAKVYFPKEFNQGPSQLSTLTGLLNTLVLLTSSFFVAQATRAMKKGKQKLTIRWLILTIIAGLSYCAIKTWEYNLNEKLGIYS